MPNPAPQPTTCARCSCELKPGTEAAHAIDGSCPHTKAPTPRELDARLRAFERVEDEKHSSFNRRFTEVAELLKHYTSEVAGVMDRVESLERAAKPAPADSPSPAPAFEMTFNQRFELLLSRDDPLKLVRCVTDLVRTALRDSREGWVTRDVARVACERYTQSPLRNEKQWNSWESCIAHAERDAMWTNSLRSKANDKQDG